MTYIDPTTVTDPTTADTVDTQAIGSYTGVPQHVIIDGKDFLIVDASSNGVAIYEINSADGSLIDPPTYLTWPQQASETENGAFDNYVFYTSPDGTTVTGFDADSTGTTALSYDIATGTWSVDYDGDQLAGGIDTTKNIVDFNTYQTEDGTIYGIGGDGTDQNFTRYEWDWTTSSWTNPTVYTAATIGATTPGDNNNAMEIVTAPDGSIYMVTETAGVTNIYEIDATTGDIIPGTNVRLSNDVATGVGFGEVGRLLNGDLTVDPNGNLVFSNEGGIQVIDPSTGTFVYQDRVGIADGGGGSFYYGSDIIYGDDGYIYLIGRDGNGNLNTKIYEIDAAGNWQFVTEGMDTTSGITWTNYVNGTFNESSNDVTTLSSGINMIYTTQEAGTNGPNTLLAAQLSTIGEDPAPVCFVAGTMIETEAGLKAVETLEKGDMIRTKDNGFKELAWVGSRTTRLDSKAQERLYPVRIRAGALGENMPSQDLYVSQQHRILVKSKIAQRMFGLDEVLIPAAKLVGVEGIELVTDCDEVTYVHFLFDQHEVVYSNGAETESLYTGPEAIKSVSLGAREEIFSLFPELKDMDYEAPAARLIPSGRMAKSLTRRHIKNNMALHSAH